MMKDKYISWGVSLGLHVVLLAAIASTGLFAMAVHKPLDEISDVVLYDAAAGDAGPDSSAADDTASPDVANSVDDIVIEDKTLPPEDVKETKSKDTPKEDTGHDSRNDDGHTGHSDGAGQSHGDGKGNGSGNGNGEGSGNGNGDGDKLTPAVKPQIISRTRAVYPENLRQKYITGTTGVSFIVGADGTVTSASVAASSGYAEFDASAVAAVQQYTFQPALNAQGQPVACQDYTNIHFNLTSHSH